jgi:hypothetical protein
MAETKVTSAEFDWTSTSLNVKSASSTSASAPANGTNTNLASVGAAVTFTVATACSAFVTVNTAFISTTEHEHKPLIYLDGSVYALSGYSASQSGTASARAIVRTYSSAVALTAGTHTISAGIGVASGTGNNVPSGGANITAIVLGRVTA